MNLGNNGIFDGVFFTYLYDTIFPFVGDFFGKIACLCDLNWVRFTNWLNLSSDYDTYAINVINLFNGEISLWNAPKLFGTLVGTVLTPFGDLCSLFLPNFYSQPVWACFIIGSLLVLFLVFLFTMLIKFIGWVVGFLPTA